eukprot:2855747-Amphidinium_carterae.1
MPCMGRFQPPSGSQCAQRHPSGMPTWPPPGIFRSKCCDEHLMCLTGGVLSMDRIIEIGRTGCAQIYSAMYFSTGHAPPPPYQA